MWLRTGSAAASSASGGQFSAPGTMLSSLWPRVGWKCTHLTCRCLDFLVLKSKFLILIQQRNSELSETIQAIVWGRMEFCY